MVRKDKALGWLSERLFILSILAKDSIFPVTIENTFLSWAINVKEIGLEEVDDHQEGNLRGDPLAVVEVVEGSLRDDLPKIVRQVT